MTPGEHGPTESTAGLTGAQRDSTATTEPAWVCTRPSTYILWLFVLGHIYNYPGAHVSCGPNARHIYNLHTNPVLSSRDISGW